MKFYQAVRDERIGDETQMKYDALIDEEIDLAFLKLDVDVPINPADVVFTGHVEPLAGQVRKVPCIEPPLDDVTSRRAFVQRMLHYK